MCQMPSLTLKDSSFEIVSHSIVKVNVSSFFKDTEIVRKRLERIYASQKFPEWQMFQAFNDYVLQVIVLKISLYEL